MEKIIKKIPPHPLPKIKRYIDNFESVFRCTDTMHSAERYFTGLLSDVPYKNCGMMAEHIEGTTAQNLQQFISWSSPWDFEKLNNERVTYMLDRAVYEDGALIFDDTGFEKKGNCSVGVARQYSGTLGKVGNCQISVSCQYTDVKYTWPVNAQLYLPEKWTKDPERLKKAKVPPDTAFKTKIQIALDMLDYANSMGIKHSVVGGDCFYGGKPVYLEALEARNERYAVSVPGDFTVRFKEEIDTFVPPEKPEGKKRGRPRMKPEPTPLPPQHKAESILGTIPESSWRTISWRDGTKGALKKQFAFMDAYWSTLEKTGSPGCIIFERPAPGEDGDIKYYFSDLPAETPDIKIVEYLHRRHTIERFYQDAKDELGLDQYEGRSWQGFHKHYGMVMLAYCWLLLQRKFLDCVIKHYEVINDPTSGVSPSSGEREIFSPHAAMG